MQYPPYIDMLFVLEIEDHIRIVWNRPESQIREIQFVRIARRPRGRMATDMEVGFLHGINEAKSGIGRPLLEVIGDRLIHIPDRQSARDNRLYLH